MPDQLKKYFKTCIGFIRDRIKKINFPVIRHRVWRFLRSWWQLIALLFAGIVFLYYPVGGMLVEDIDTNTNIEIVQNRPEQSSAVEMMSFIINREVSKKMWTPNLPFFFPSYFLDNMPNFQLGMMSSVSTLAQAMSQRLARPIDDKQEQHLIEAAKLLQYPGNIWMFSPENRLMPAPSSNSQYKKARKQLIKYSYSLNDGSEVFYRNPGDLAYFMDKLATNLAKGLEKIETQVREYSSNFTDNKADDIFYYTRGQIYADYLLLKALGADYKHIILDHNLYLPWTQMLSALELGAQISPTIVRNGELNSITAPNHLIAIAFYTTRARSLMREISQTLKKRAPRPQ